MTQPVSVNVASESDERKRQVRKRRALVLAILLVACIYGAIWYWIFRYNPLPSDEAMIAHFHAHRTQIEELVKRYREFQRPPDKDHYQWQAPAEVQALMKAAGVVRVDYLAGVWLPDPYSIETAIRRDALSRMKDEELGFDLLTRYGTISVELALSGPPYRNTARYSAIWKELFFYPEVPKVEGSWLLHPSGARGEPGNRYRVLDSLNGFPPDWKKGECVMRRVEPQWFISMCRST